MSSSLEGSAFVATGVVLLGGAGLAVAGAAAFGSGWILYQTGKLTFEIIKGIDDAANEAQQKYLAEMQMRKECSQKRRVHIEALKGEFQKEIQNNIRSFNAQENVEIYIKKMKELSEQAEQITFHHYDSAEEMEAENEKNLLWLEKLISDSERLQVQIESENKIAEDCRNMEQLLQFMKKIRSMAPEKSVVSDVKLLSEEERTRAALWQKYMQIVSNVYTAVLREERRRQAFPLTVKQNNRLHNIFDEIEKRMDYMNDLFISNEDMERNLYRMEQVLAFYPGLRQELDEQEAEFVTLYNIYKEVRCALNLPVKEKNQFSDAEELKKELEELKLITARAEKCGRIYEAFGEDGYLSLAFDTEMKALGYPVAERTEIKEQLKKHSCAKGIEIPAYDLPQQKAVTQMYQVDENCQLQLIIQDDGTTSIQTIAIGNDYDGIVETQKRHCARAQELMQRLRDNWFISCSIQETESPEKIKKSIIGIRENDGNVRKNETVSDVSKKNAKYMK